MSNNSWSRRHIDPSLNVTWNETISCVTLVPAMRTYDRHWTCSMYVFPSGLSSFIYPCYHLQLSVSIRILKQTQESERNRHIETEALLAAMSRRGQEPNSSNALMLTGMTEDIVSSPPQSPQSDSMKVGINLSSWVSSDSFLASCASSRFDPTDVRRTASCRNGILAPSSECLWSSPRHRESTPTYALCSPYYERRWHSRHTPDKTSGYARGHKVTSARIWADHRTRPGATKLYCPHFKAHSRVQKIFHEGWESYFQSTALENYR